MSNNQQPERLPFNSLPLDLVLQHPQWVVLSDDPATQWGTINEVRGAYCSFLSIYSVCDNFAGIPFTLDGRELTDGPKVEEEIPELLTGNTLLLDPSKMPPDVRARAMKGAQFQASLDAIDRMPSEVAQAAYEKVKGIGGGGPTVEEYLKSMGEPPFQPGDVVKLIDDPFTAEVETVRPHLEDKWQVKTKGDPNWYTYSIWQLVRKAGDLDGYIADLEADRKQVADLVIKQQQAELTRLRKEIEALRAELQENKDYKEMASYHLELLKKQLADKEQENAAYREKLEALHKEYKEESINAKGPKARLYAFGFKDGIAAALNALPNNQKQ